MTTIYRCKHLAATDSQAVVTVALESITGIPVQLQLCVACNDEIAATWMFALADEDEESNTA